MSNEQEKLHIVTEIGVFGELDVEDPTASDVEKKKKMEELEETIAEAITENYNTLTK